MLTGLTEDLKHAARSLRRSGGFAIAVVLLIAGGLGLATLMLAVVFAVTLRPLPYPKAEDLVGVMALRSPSCAPECIDLVSGRALEDVQSLISSIHHLAYYSQRTSLMGVPGDRSDVTVTEVSKSFFETFDVRPRLGRWLLASDFENATSDVAVVSYRWWIRQGSSRDILNRHITIDGANYLVVGIMPSDFVATGGEVWVPSQRGSRPGDGPAVQAIGRIRQGLSAARANQELQLLSSRELREDSSWNGGRTIFVYPLVDELRPGAATLRPLIPLVLLIVIVTYANAQSLFIVRALRMRRDLAIRSALGATRSRIAQYWCVETGLVVIASIALASLLVVWGLGLAKRVIGDEAPSIFAIGNDPRVLVLEILLASAAAVTLSWQAFKSASTTSLRGEMGAGALGGTMPVSRMGIRKGIVVVQIVMAVLLSSAAGALYLSYANLNRLDLGFDADRMLVSKMDIRQTTYDSNSELSALSTRLAERLDAIPAVSAAAIWRDVSPISLTLPSEPTITIEHSEARIDGRRCPTGNCIHPIVSQDVTPDFFRVVGSRIVRGRAFTSRDEAGAPYVTIINQFAAARWWPGQDPIGKRFKLGGLASPTPWLTVVGVVSVKRPVQWIAAYLRIDPKSRDYAIMFRPLAQIDASLGRDLKWAQPLWIAVRSESANSATLARSMRTTLRETAPEATFENAVGFRHVVLAEGGWDHIRTGKVLAASCALFAIALSMAGIYGIIADLARRRTREMGIRMALGARPSRVVMHVAKDGARMAVLGVIVGVCICSFFGGIARDTLFGAGSTELYGTSFSDPRVLLPVALGAIVASMLASVIPALQLTRIRPAEAFRVE